jgi:ribosome-binding ATPase YchF (GTP1/OBG family)
MEIATISSAIIALNAIIQVCKNIETKLNKDEKLPTEDKSEIDENLDKLKKIKEELEETKSQIIERDKKIRELEKELERDKNYTQYKDAIYIKNDYDHPYKDPHCLRCFEIDKNPVKLIKSEKVGVKVCPQCKSEYSRSEAPRL